MKKYVKAALVIFLVLGLTLDISFTARAQIEVPEKIRIGLFFTDKTSGVNTAVSSFSVTAVKGLQIGTFERGNFVPLQDVAGESAITVRKDSYFVVSNGVYTEYSPDQKPTQTGERVGPYHVRIGGPQKDISSVTGQISLLKEKGIAAYPAYVDGWEVWTGFFTDEASAKKYIDGTLKPALGDGIGADIRQPSEKAVVIQDNGGEVKMVYCSSNGVLQVRPNPENNPYAFTINGKSSYRGDLEVRRQQGSDMTVINILSMDQYLYGVVPAEIQASSHPEALKAQAVAARTYAMAHLGKYAHIGFDLCTTTLSQVYKGLSGEDPRTNKAVDDTSGIKIIYNGSLAKDIYFFSSSGGRTEDPKNVWGGEIPYLKSVEDKYESGKSYKYNWEVTFTSEEVKQRMKQLGYDVGDILNITITQVSEAGRPIELVVQGTKDKVVFTKSRCRTAFNLDSQLFTISTDAEVAAKSAETTSSKVQLSGSKVMTADGLKTLTAGSAGSIMAIGGDNTLRPISAVPATYTFTGKGWGHAVGMSQEGAKGMAEAGFTYVDILKHYFTGVEVE